MPDFWQFQAGGCGAGNLTFSGDFSAGPFQCHDLWQGRASGGGQYGGSQGPVPDGNRARLKFSWYVVPDDPAFVPGGRETYLCRITIRLSHAARCRSGCTTPVCVMFVEESLGLLGGQTQRFTNPDQVLINQTGQSGGPSAASCPMGQMVRRGTWGSVKQLYR
jgi:hypothetical protein